MPMDLSWGFELYLLSYCSPSPDSYRHGLSVTCWNSQGGTFSLLIAIDSGPWQGVHIATFLAARRSYPYDSKNEKESSARLPRVWHLIEVLYTKATICIDDAHTSGRDSSFSSQHGLSGFMFCFFFLMRYHFFLIGIVATFEIGKFQKEKNQEETWQCQG